MGSLHWVKEEKAYVAEVDLIEQLKTILGRYGRDTDEITLITRGDGFNYFYDHQMVLFGISIPEATGSKFFPIISMRGPESYNVRFYVLK